MNDERIIAYLLDELSPDESARFEEECFDAETWPDEVRLVEDELIEDYLSGDLSPERRERFRLNYLTTAARRERVHVAAALLRHAEETAPAAVAVEEKEPAAVTPPARPTFLESLRGFWGGHAWAPRALAALLLVAALVVVWRSTRPAEPRNLIPLELIAANVERGPGDEERRIPLPHRDDALDVTLRLSKADAATPVHRVDLEGERWVLMELKPVAQDAEKVRVVIPAARLRRGQYVLKLYTLEADGAPRRLPGNYFLNVE
jgi:hypothetical protein